MAPVAGLTHQMKHAKTIVDTAEEMKLPKRAAVVAVATAMQETNLATWPTPGCLSRSSCRTTVLGLTMTRWVCSSSGRPLVGVRWTS